MKQITFTAKIVVDEPGEGEDFDITLMHAKEKIDQGAYVAEFIMPLGIEPTIIVHLLNDEPTEKSIA